ncbi:MAG: IS4 family transposase [Thermoflexales bacterium]
MYRLLFDREWMIAQIAAMTDEMGKPVRLYWRLYTPLITLWGMLYQRLNADHGVDAALRHLLAGGTDGLDSDGRGRNKISEGAQSDSTSAYAQARGRLPVGLVEAGLSHVHVKVTEMMGDAGMWRGHSIRLLDGTTYRMGPQGDLAATFGQAKNQHGKSHWVIAKSMAAFDWKTGCAIGHAEGPGEAGEVGLVHGVLQKDTQPNSVYLMDQGLGVYRVAQSARANGQHVLMRMQKMRALAMLKGSGHAELGNGDEAKVMWRAGGVRTEPGLSTDPIAGRLIYRRIETPGFRPLEIYLFTTLLDAKKYPQQELVEIAARRWQVEPNYRHIKTDMGMDDFKVKSAEMFRRELAVGLLAYNLIRALMAQAAKNAGIAPLRLSFTRCMGRIVDVCTIGVPDWVRTNFPSVLDYLLGRLEKCALPNQPNKVRHEPRAVRRKPAVYPSLKGDRDVARRQLLDPGATIS